MSHHKKICTALSGPAFTHIQNLTLWFGPHDFSSRSLRNFLFTRYSLERRHHSDPPISQTDSLNSVLRTLSTQLQELHIHGVFFVSPDLFTSRDAETSEVNNQVNQPHVQPSWTYLRGFRVTTTLLTPSGYNKLIPPHLFSRQPTRPVPFTIKRALKSATLEFNKPMTSISQAMLSMPRLQLLTISFLTGPAEPVYPDIDWSRNPHQQVNWARRDAQILHWHEQHLQQILTEGGQVPPQTYEIVRYNREENEKREIVDGGWRGGIKEKTEENGRGGDGFCTLEVFNKEFVARNKELFWRPFPEEVVRNWNEVHRRIKGLSELEGWSVI